METKEKRRYLIETAIGLQAVDGLKVSEFFLFQADRYIEGEITLKELEELVSDYHKSKPYQGIYLSKEDYKIIFLIEKNPYITSEELSEELGVSVRTVKSLIATLKEKGIIERVGGKKHGHWEVKK